MLLRSPFSMCEGGVAFSPAGSCSKSAMVWRVFEERRCERRGRRNMGPACHSSLAKTCEGGNGRRPNTSHRPVTRAAASLVRHRCQPFGGQRDRRRASPLGATSRHVDRLRSRQEGVGGAVTARVQRGACVMVEWQPKYDLRRQTRWVLLVCGSWRGTCTCTLWLMR